MKVLGIDLGSRTVKMVILNNDSIEKTMIHDTSLFYREYCNYEDKKINVDFKKLDIGEFDKIISTGYGRNNININGSKIITELKAHAIGASWQTNIKDFTILDVGGQDSKVIDVKNGKMVDMILNDKCAASCGRYIENMANVLSISLEELEKHSVGYISLNSTCAVFGESELIGKISEGYRLSELSASVNYSLFKRIKPLIEKFSNQTLIVTGGVAKNQAIVSFIKNEMNFENVIVPKEPQLNGAIGCCVFGSKL